MKSQSTCPSCKAVLEFDRALLSVVKCPKCSYQGVVADFKEIKKQVERSVTTAVIPDNHSGSKLYKPGKLELLESDAAWLQKERIVDLRRGINTIGRRSPNSASNVQLPVTDTYLGKEHAIIDVVMKADGIFEHRLSDKKSRNGTYHNGERLEENDTIKLAAGDTIRMGHTLLKFVAG